MKTNNKRLIGLIVISLVQLSFPFFFIAAKEEVIETGKEYLFRINPVDPYDFFQGKYVRLNVPPLKCIVNNQADFEPNDIVYAEFNQDTAGAVITALSHKKTKNSLKLKLDFQTSGEFYVNLPFRRFYVEETKAMAIENQLLTDRQHANFVHVKILKGDFVMTDISSNGKSLITGKPVNSPALASKNQSF